MDNPSNAAQILADAAAIVGGNAADRDLGAERSMARCVKAFNAITGHALSERDGWMLMVMLKATRACTTPTGKADDYLDLAAYAALAGESVEPADPQIDLPLTGWRVCYGLNEMPREVTGKEFSVLLRSGHEVRGWAGMDWRARGRSDDIMAWRLAQPEKSDTLPVTQPGDKL